MLAIISCRIRNVFEEPLVTAQKNPAPLPPHTL